jgi:hypothetical protein
MAKKLDTPSLNANGITFDDIIEETISSTRAYFMREDIPQAILVAEGLLDFEQILFKSDLV